MQTLTSRHNPLYKELASLKKDRGFMLLEGRRLVEDALLRGINPRMIAVTPDFMKDSGLSAPPDVVMSEKLFAGVCETETPQGVLAFFDIPWADMSEIAQRERVVILDGLQDPGNVGTIVRSAEAFGFSGMAVMEGTASPFSAKAVRASMGSCLGLRIARCTIDDLRQLPHHILAMTAQGRKKLSPALFVGPKVAVCLGREAAGVSMEIIEISHDTVFIPMKGRTESLNVAVAAGIVMACAAGII
ncbi:MAG TPA: RNA methyltransferase [Desulfomonilia bacterium]|nr:RNA methyltransferase [Desulfomonilia bacterium]